MTFILFKVNGDTFIFRKITYDSTTERFDIKTEAVETGIQTIFNCLKWSEQYSFVEGLHKNPPPTEIKNQKPDIELSKRLQRSNDQKLFSKFIKILIFLNT